MQRIDHLAPLQKTLLLPLKGRAADSAVIGSMLHDHLAATLVSSIDYDFYSIPLGAGVQQGIALRSRILDRAVCSFVRKHPDAVVVELGSGLETRKFRLGITADVEWHDVDFPEVIALRDELMPEYPRSHSIGISLLDPAWADTIPTDRPVLVVADSLFGFLGEDETRRILGRIADRFKTGELVFSAYTALTARMTGHYTKSVGMPARFRGYGFNDPYRFQELDARFTFVDEETRVSAPETWTVTGRESLNARVNARLFSRLPTLARSGVWVIRHRF